MSITVSQQTLLTRYLDSLNGTPPHSAAAAFYASLDHINTVSPTVGAAIVKELSDQRRNLKLIASENYSSLATQLACGNLFTDNSASCFTHP